MHYVSYISYFREKTLNRADFHYVYKIKCRALHLTRDVSFKFGGTDVSKKENSLHDPPPSRPASTHLAAHGFFAVKPLVCLVSNPKNREYQNKF